MVSLETPRSFAFALQHSGRHCNCHTLAHGFCLKGLVTDHHFLVFMRNQSPTTRKALLPLQTTSSHFKPLQATSSHFISLHATSCHFKPLQATSNHLKRPLRHHISTSIALQRTTMPRISRDL